MADHGEQMYECGENSGYADWELALGDHLPDDVDALPSHVAEYLVKVKAENAQLKATLPSADLYFCPQAGEVESATRGGFDQCCDQPELHVPLPDGPGTEALSQLLDQVARRVHAERTPAFQRLAEMAARAVAKAEAVDQASFALAPSPTGGATGEKNTHDVRGRCPACSSASLFLAEGGYITCSWIDCPNPDAASQLLREVAG